MSEYSVKIPMSLNLEIKSCSAETYALLVRLARDSGETPEQFCESTAMGMLEAVDQTWSEEDYRKVGV